VRVTVAACVDVALFPVIVNTKVPREAFEEGVTVRVDDPDPPLIVAGAKLAVTPEGRPATLRETGSTNPPRAKVEAV